MFTDRRDSGVNAIESLMERRGAFDYILLETSGVADPGNIAPLFWVDDGLGSTIYLDGIVTVVDAKNIVRSLDEHASSSQGPESDSHVSHPGETTAHIQISHADVLILNKVDTVPESTLHIITDRIRGINGVAKLEVTEYGHLSKLDGVILDLHAYDEVGHLATYSHHAHPDPVSVSRSSNRNGSMVWQWQTIYTVTFEIGSLDEKQLVKLDAWLQSVLWESELPASRHLEDTSTPAEFQIHRLKGLVVMHSGEVRMIQGVREVFEVTERKKMRKDDEQQLLKRSKVVIIGRNVRNLAWRNSLVEYLDLSNEASL